MPTIRATPAFAAILALALAVLPSARAAAAKPDPYVEVWGHYPSPDPYVRIHGSYPHTSYLGLPNLRLTLALVDAGGGPHRFSAARLVSVMAGPHTRAELADLKRHYGERNIDSFLSTFTYAVDDTLTFLKTTKLKMPNSPAPSPSNGKALVAAVYRAGVMPDGKYDCGYMMEHLMSRPGHVQVMKDIDGNKAFGPNANANFHIILTKVVFDLKRTYHV